MLGRSFQQHQWFSVACPTLMSKLITVIKKNAMAVFRIFERNTDYGLGIELLKIQTSTMEVNFFV